MFEDAFSRYLPPSDAQSRNSRNNPREYTDCGPSTTRNRPSLVTGPHEDSNLHENSDVTAVTAQKPADGSRPPRLGEEMFPLLLADAVKHGYVTDREARDRYALHKLVENSS